MQDALVMTIGNMTIGELIEKYSITKDELIDYLNEFSGLGHIDRDESLDRVIPSKYVLAVREKFWDSITPPTGLKIVGKIDLSPRIPKVRKRERVRTNPKQREEVQVSKPLSQKEKEIEMAYEELERQREEEAQKIEEAVVDLEVSQDDSTEADDALVNGTYEEYLHDQEWEESQKEYERLLEQQKKAKEETERKYRMREQAIRDIINAEYANTFAPDDYVGIEYTYDSWVIVQAPKDAYFLVDVNGKVVFHFPHARYHVYRSIREQGVVDLSRDIENPDNLYSSYRTMSLNHPLRIVYHIDCPNKRIALGESFSNNDMFPRLRFETIYDDNQRIIKKNICVGEQSLLPRVLYNRFEAFRSTNWLILLGYKDEECDAVFLNIENVKDESSIEKQLINLTYPFKRTYPFHINSSNVSWVQKTYLHLTKRYPIIEYIDKDGHWRLMFNGVIIADSFTKHSVAVIYDSKDTSKRRRRSWARLRDSKKEYLEYEDFRGEKSIGDSLIVCDNNKLYSLDGNLYHAFDKHWDFVDSWFEYIAYHDDNQQVRIFKFIESRELLLEYGYHDSPEEFRYVSPKYGVITGVFDFDTFEQNIWDISFKSDLSDGKSVLVATDSLGNNYVILLSGRLSSFLSRTTLPIFEALHGIKDNVVVLGLGNGAYGLVMNTEPILVEVLCKHTYEDKGRSLLYIGSDYECFDNGKGVFAPDPELDSMMRKIERQEWEHRLEQTEPETYSMLEALEDWSNYWNID